MESGKNVFAGRTIHVVRDLSVDEQVYLYEKSRLIKEAFLAGDRREMDRFRLSDQDLCVYLAFLEDSTRTKESFRNAAKFHNVKVNDFTSAGSSFNKNESVTDTMKMLAGYSTRSIFVVRSRMEGVCRWLERAVSDHTKKLGLPRPAFINGGDGRHEHPTQEFLDEFSFLEQMNWDRSHLHIALVGDLFHGRTVHSKADGLRIFQKVEVDLIAPPELAMPPYYVDQMQRAGFSVRFFPSIQAYLDQKHVAKVWYFTRLQLERMGDQLLEKADKLRSAVTFDRTYMDRVLEGTSFYHPLPRHSATPTIPAFLDRTPLNGWDRQSMNGLFTRIAELGLVGGNLGADFAGESRKAPEFPDDFVEEVGVSESRKPNYKIGIKPVDNGVVIDHIGKGKSPEEIWEHIDKIRSILDLNVLSSHGVYYSATDGASKGIISLPDFARFDDRQIKMLGAIAPGCTFNMIANGAVKEKYRLRMPRRVYDLDQISCKNEDCVSHWEQHEHVVPEFHRSAENTFVCMYCERPHDFREIW